MHRILIVDDHIGTLATLTVALEGDFLVDTATTAVEALRRLSEHSPDLALLEVGLPDLSSIRLMRTIRARLPSCPVIAMTGLDPTEALRELTALRVDGFFRKPFTVDAVIEQINVLLGRRPPLPPSRPQRSSHVNKAIEYLTHHYAEPLTVQAVGQAIGVSPSHLAHLFPAETGLTVRRYLARVRIEVAKRLLLDTDETLDDIADRAGFCDASHLSRLIRQSTGYSPKAYRATARRTRQAVTRAPDLDGVQRPGTAIDGRGCRPMETPQC